MSSKNDDLLTTLKEMNAKTIIVGKEVYKILKKDKRFKIFKIIVSKNNYESNVEYESIKSTIKGENQ